MSSILRAAAAYFILVFAVRWGMGALSALYLAPHLGAIGAAAVTAGVTILVAWPAALLFIRLFAVPAFSGPRLVMGAIALLLLILAEARLSLYSGLGLAQHFATFRSAAGLINLAGQLVFALIPGVQIVLKRRPAA
jgi:hypothetical protein